MNLNIGLDSVEFTIVKIVHGIMFIIQAIHDDASSSVKENGESLANAIIDA
jgi:hypothetical protein